MPRFVASLVVKPFSPNQSSKNYEGECYSFPYKNTFIGSVCFISLLIKVVVMYLTCDSEPAFHDQ